MYIIGIPEHFLKKHVFIYTFLYWVCSPCIRQVKRSDLVPSSFSIHFSFPKFSYSSVFFFFVFILFTSFCCLIISITLKLFSFFNSMVLQYKWICLRSLYTNRTDLHWWIWNANAEGWPKLWFCLSADKRALNSGKTDQSVSYSYLLLYWFWEVLI